MADTKKGERDPANSPRKKEVYEYSAPWQLYGMNWSFRPDKRFRLALGSFVEDYSNKVDCAESDKKIYLYTKMVWCLVDNYLAIWRFLSSAVVGTCVNIPPRLPLPLL